MNAIHGAEQDIRSVPHRGPDAGPPHACRQIEVGDRARHVEQLQTEERHHVRNDDPDQEHLGRDAQGFTGRDLCGEDGA